MISIVIPLFNEEKSLLELYESLIGIINGIDKTYEIIFVDDGSTDGSLLILKELARKNSHVRVFSFRKNQGKAEALSFAFAKSKGDYIVTLDADLQDKPVEIPKLLEKAKNGWDLVCGWRKNRQDSKIKVLSSRLFNLIVQKLWGLSLHDYNCGLKVYKKDAAQSLRIYGGLHRFIPLLVYQQGFTVCEEAVVHEKRKHGKSKFGFSKIWKDLPDIFTVIFLSRYSSRPFHFFGTIGGMLVFSGICILGYLTFIWFQGESIGRRPLLFLGMLLILSGFQVFFTGFLADLIINISYKNGLEDEDAGNKLKYISR